MGKAEARILKDCYTWHREIPDRIKNAPELHLGLELYLEAFMELNTCRSVSWSAGPIPWSAVQDYGMTFEFAADEMEDLHYHIRRMDAAFLDQQDSKPKN